MLKVIIAFIHSVNSAVFNSVNNFLLSGLLPAFCPMHPEYDRGSTDHAYITHNVVSEVTFPDASMQCSDNYQGGSLPIVDTIDKHQAATAKIHRSFRKLIASICSPSSRQFGIHCS